MAMCIMSEKCDVCDVELVSWWNPIEVGYGSTSCPKCGHIFRMICCPYIPEVFIYKPRYPKDKKANTR